MAPAAWLTASGLRAADFWQENPDYRDWTMDNVQHMLYRSPWVQQAYLEPLGVFGASAGVGDFHGNGVLDGPAPGAGAASFSQQRVHVRWHSARPVREAITRALMGPAGEKELTAEQQEWLDARRDQYILSVSGLSASLAQIVELVDGLAERAYLERKGRDPIPASAAESVSGAAGLELYFLFPRTNPIERKDRQVEFVADLAGAQSGAGASIPVHARFKVKDLVYRGELAL